MSKKMAGIRNLLLMATLLGSTLSARASNEEMTIGTIYLDTQGYYAEVRQGIQDTVRDSSVQVQLTEASVRGDISKEDAFVDTLMERDANTTILSTMSGNGSSRTVRRVSEASIPVICYNTYINQKGTNRYASAYPVGDPLESGKKLGNTAADYFIADKIDQPKIAVISCEAFEVCVQRRKGLEEILKIRVPDVRIVVNQEGTALDKAISVGEKLIISMPDLNAIMGKSGGATFGAVKAVRDQNQVGKIAVFGPNMTTEITQELENSQVLKAVVDTSDKKMDNAVSTQTLKAISRQADGERVIQAPVDFYTKTEDGKQWLATHIDGLPQLLIRRGSYARSNRGSPNSKSDGRK